MICNRCTIFYNSSDNQCPQCKIMAMDRLFQMNDIKEIDKHIKEHYMSIFKYYINKHNMETTNINQKIKTFMITKKRFMNNLNDYLKLDAYEILIYMSGLKDGIRKCISASIADIIFSNLIDYHKIFVNENEINLLIHSIGPFIIDPWNCLYENHILIQIYIKPYQLLSLEGLFTQWDYRNVLCLFENIPYASCPYCSYYICLNDLNTKCAICNEHFHNQCFNNLYHHCKMEHHENNIDSLIDNLIDL
jgi:hypothetical protein